MRCDRGVEHGGGETFILREQVVSEFMEIADAADARRPRDDLIHVAHQFTEQACILGVALNEAVRRMLQRLLMNRAVFGEIIEADDLMTGVEQLFHEIAADEAGGAGDEDFHGMQS